MKTVLVFLLCIFSAGSLVSQQPSADLKIKPADSSSATSLAELPKIRLDFGEAKEVAGVTGSPLIGNGKQCTPDGVVFVRIAVPPLYRELQVIALGGESGGRAFSLSLVPNSLQDILLKDYFPAGSEIAFLVKATEDAEQSEYHVATPDGKVIAGKGFRGKHHDYVIFYDRKGSYKSTIELPEGDEYTRLAELESGELVLLAYNPVSRVADLQLVNSSGQYEHTLQIPPKLTDDPALVRGETGGVVEASVAMTELSRWQFTSSRGKVILFRPGSAGMVLEVGAGGAVREVPLASPEGFELDSFVPANDRWVVRYRREGLPERGPVDIANSSGNFLLFDVNPFDGSLRTQLELSGTSDVFGVACESDGGLTQVAIDDKMKFQISKADIPK